MQLSLSIFALVAFLHSVAADLEAQAGTSCGRTYYSSSDVDKASSAACDFVKEEETAGRSSYPHRYNNFEGFHFHGMDGPFYEFPILSSGRIYRGGRPGPDRVIITEDCEQAGQITHSGAGGSSFVGCSGTD
ncbi:hypothetical protein CDD83_3966 [Cordyceps sp. RAO-2017]|nr:hypothetical protein CDD83_3966 [Cordyceps sp. RAO-2017]